MRLLFIVLITVISVTACKNYDEGPSLSLISKKARLTGEWEVASYFLNGNELRLTNKEEMTVKKDGTFSKATIIGTNSFYTNGNWAFSEDKATLLMTYSATTTETWTIKKLSNKQLFVEFAQPSGSVVRYEFVKKTK